MLINIDEQKFQNNLQYVICSPQLHPWHNTRPARPRPRPIFGLRPVLS